MQLSLWLGHQRNISLGILVFFIMISLYFNCRKTNSTMTTAKRKTDLVCVILFSPPLAVHDPLIHITFCLSVGVYMATWTKIHAGIFDSPDNGCWQRVLLQNNLLKIYQFIRIHVKWLFNLNWFSDEQPDPIKPQKSSDSDSHGRKRSIESSEPIKVGNLCIHVCAWCNILSCARETGSPAKTTSQARRQATTQKLYSVGGLIMISN